MSFFDILKLLWVEGGVITLVFFALISAFSVFLVIASIRKKDFLALAFGLFAFLFAPITILGFNSGALLTQDSLSKKFENGSIDEGTLKKLMPYTIKGEQGVRERIQKEKERVKELEAMLRDEGVEKHREEFGGINKTHSMEKQA